MTIDPQELLAAIREHAKKTGRVGGLTRAKNMTPEERRRIAVKASKAAAKARSEAAKLKKIEETIAEGTKKLKTLVAQNKRAKAKNLARSQKRSR